MSIASSHRMGKNLLPVAVMVIGLMCASLACNSERRRPPLPTQTPGQEVTVTSAAPADTPASAPTEPSPELPGPTVTQPAPTPTVAGDEAGDQLEDRLNQLFGTLESADALDDVPELDE
jgi:hypothetical protein